MKKIICSLLIICLFLLAGCTEEKDPLLYEAILDNDTEYINEYFTKNHDKINSSMPTSSSSESTTSYPLLYACKNNASFEVIKLLVDDFGANVNILNQEEEFYHTPLCALHQTTRNDFDEVTKYLLDKGADIDVLNNDIKRVTYQEDINGLEIVCYEDGAVQTYKYHFSYEVLTFIFENDIMKDEVKFTSICLDKIAMEFIELDKKYQDAEYDELMEYLNFVKKYQEVLKLFIYQEINEEYFTTQETKTYIKLLKELLETLKDYPNLEDVLDNDLDQNLEDEVFK